MNVEDIPGEVLNALANRKSGIYDQTRMNAIDQGMTPQWKVEMQASLNDVETANASSKSKIPKLYKLIDRADEKRRAYTACKKGCNACCHMQVEISDVEAARIALHAGRDYVRLRPGRNTTPINALGRKSTPCTFLENSECSIYEARPFVCRELAVVDIDALACSFENMALARANDPRAITVAQTKVGPVADAFTRLVVRPSASFGDIRQFFPKGES